MQPGELERYLHQQIPLASAMEVAVSAVSSDSVVLTAPLAPNINHKRTAFGGSLSGVAILAAWSLVHVRLREEALHGEIVIQSNQMRYDRPVTEAFCARAVLTVPNRWPAFVDTLRRRSRARVEVQADVMVEDDRVAQLNGRFVALLRAP